MSEPILYLIDGSSYIFRAYYAVRNMSNSKGFPTNALYGFTSMVFKFLEDYDPNYLAMVFDSKGKTFKSNIYPEYKANREQPPEDLKPQFPKIFEMVDAFSIPLIQIEGYEADDLMGTIAKSNELKGIYVVLVTGDKDFCQLVSEKVTMLDTMKKKKTEIDDVKEKYGVSPEQMIDFQALMGDSIDNIPGVKGVGEKTASALISEYRSLDNLYNNLETVNPPRIKKLLEESRDNAYLSRDLVKIKTDILSVDSDIEKYKYSGFDSEKLSKMFTEYEFKNLFNKIGKTNSVPKSENDNYKLVLSEQHLNEVINIINEEGQLSIDLETTSKLPMEAEIVGYAITPNETESYYVPVGHTVVDNREKQLSPEYVLEKLKPILENEKIKKIGQNLKYDLVILKNNNVNLSGIYFDTMIAAHLLDSSLTSYKLDELSKVYLEHPMISYDDVTGKGKNRINFSEVDLDIAMRYACEDSEIAFKLYGMFFESLKEKGLLDFYLEKSINFIDVLSEMELAGVMIDVDCLAELSEEFEETLKNITEQIYKEVGTVFNIRSTLQLREVLFKQFGLPIKKRTKKGEPSTDVEVLTDLSKHHKVPDLILKHRALSKLKSTYVDSLPKLINSRTNRLHTYYNPVGTSTGRLSSSDPNLQNIPIKTENGRRIRRAFIANEGYTILSADYSQIELRLLAHFSKDETLIEAFNKNQDIHNRTASEVFKVSEDEVTQRMRRMAKNINFGIIYGISPFGLSKQLGITVSSSNEYMNRYFSRYSKVKEYMDSSVMDAQNKGYSETLVGRRRPIKELDSQNKILREAGKRVAINTPIQGSAADIINLAMINIHNKIVGKYRSKMLLQVHDELVFELFNEESGEFEEIIKREMENVWELRVPLKVDVGRGKNWAEAH